MNSFLETVIFFYVLRHPELVRQFKGKFFKTECFQELFEILKPYVLEYRAEPPEAQVNDLVNLAGKQGFITPEIVHTIWANRSDLGGYSEDWLFKNTKAFAEWNNFLRGLQRVMAYIKQMQGEVTFENCDEIISQAKTMWGSEMAFCIGGQSGHDFFDLSTHQIPEESTVSTGYPFFDMCLSGGLASKTLNCIMAAPKTGKTMWLCNIAAQLILGGKNVIFITLEMSYQKIAQRIGSILFGIPMVDYKRLSHDEAYMQEKMRAFHNQNVMVPPGKLILEQFPTGTATMEDIEAFVLKKEEELSAPDKPFKFHVVITDYVNIMRSAQYSRTESLYIKVKSICEEYRAACIRNDWAGLTATQINRSGFGSTDMDMSNVSESAGLLATVDSLFGIIRTPLMKQAGVYYIKAILTRDSDSMGYKKKFNMDKHCLKIAEDPGEAYMDEGIELPDEWKSESVFDAKRGGGVMTGANAALFNQQKRAASAAPAAPPAIHAVPAPAPPGAQTQVQSLLPQTPAAPQQPAPQALPQQQAPQLPPVPRRQTPPMMGGPAGQPGAEGYPKVDLGLTERQLAGIPLGIF